MAGAAVLLRPDRLHRNVPLRPRPRARLRRAAAVRRWTRSRSCAAPTAGRTQSPTATLQRYEERLARALTSIIHVLDPDVIVLGGGVSNVERLYRNVPPLLRPFGGDRPSTRLVKAVHGDSSGVRGAAWLWENSADPGAAGLCNRLPQVTPALSFVIPLYNSAATIAALVRDIENLTIEGGHEIVLVNDGSADNTTEVCRELVRSARVPITFVEHARNFGEHNAVLTGWRHASGAHIVNLDDDGQNPPVRGGSPLAARGGNRVSTSCSATTRSSSTRRGETWAAVSPTR